MKKNVASQVIGAQMVSATDGSAFTGAATVVITGDGGTQSASGGTGPTHEGNGYHTYLPTQAETNFDQIGFTFTGSGAVPVTVQVYTTFPQTGDNYARLGAPAGASVSADIATVDTVVDGIQTDLDNGTDGLGAIKADTAAILVDTADIQPKLGTVTDLGGGATVGANLSDMAGATFSTVTDTLEAIRDRGDAAWTTGAGGSDRLLMVDTTIATLASQTSFTLTAGSADDNAYVNCTIVIEDVATATQKAVGLISAYTGISKTVTLKYDPGVFTMAATDKVYILAENSLKSTAQNRQLDVTATGAAGIDWANVENPTTAVDLSATDIQLCDTVTTNTDMRGTDSAATAASLATAQADLDTLTGADGATLATSQPNYAPATAAALTTHDGKLDTVDANVDTLLARITSTLFSGITSLAEWLGLLAGKQAGDATALTEIKATGAGAGTYDPTTDANEAIRDTAPLGTAMRGTDSAALATVCTEARLAELDAANIPADLDAVLVDTADMQPKLGTPAGASVSADIASVQTDTTAIVADTNEIQAELADGGRTDLLIDAIKAKTDLLPESPAKNTAFTYVIKMVDSTDHVTPKTGLSPTMTVCLDGGAFAAKNASSAVTEISTGHYKVVAAAADMNGDTVVHRFTGTAADDLTMEFVTVA